VRITTRFSGNFLIIGSYLLPAVWRKVNWD